MTLKRQLHAGRLGQSRERVLSMLTAEAKVRKVDTHLEHKKSVQLKVLTNFQLFLTSVDFYKNERGMRIQKLTKRAQVFGHPLWVD